MTKKWFSILAMLVITSMILVACGGDATPTTAPVAPTNTTAAAAGAPTATTAAAAPTDTISAAAPTNTTAVTTGETPTVMSGTNAMSPDKAPPVPNPNKSYSGQQIIYYGDTVGLGAQLDQSLAKAFTADTGIAVKIVPKPQNATENYSTYQRFFQAQSPDVDVMMLDVIWPGAFAQHLVDLSPKLGDLAKLNYPGIIENNTVDGKLVAMPWFGDFGMLYYRTDLLTEVRLQRPAQDLGRTADPGPEDQGRREGQQPQLRGLRLPGQRL